MSEQSSNPNPAEFLFSVFDCHEKNNYGLRVWIQDSDFCDAVLNLRVNNSVVNPKDVIDIMKRLLVEREADREKYANFQVYPARKIIKKLEACIK